MVAIAAARIGRCVRATLALALMCSLLPCALAQARAGVPALAPRADAVRAVCPAGAGSGVRCHALELTAPGVAADSGPARRAAVAGAAQTPECHIPLPSEGCYGLRPQDLHSAYELPQASIAPQTIAVVTAGGDPRIRKDLANYDREFGLEGCASEPECPTVLNGEGKRSPLPAVEGEAPLETSLDVEVAHAVCSGCKLLLIEASAGTLAAFELATDTAARLGAQEISISWGEGEPASVPEEGAAFDHPGVVITASAGDTGYLNWASAEAERGRPEYPASSPDVLAVGGTTLELGAGDEWKDERVWDQLEPRDEGGGSGCSALFAAPPWQLALPHWGALGCGAKRATADLAAVADPRLGVAVYDSVKNAEGLKPGWRRLGGTSVGAPLIAGAFALAGGARGVADPAQTLYRNAAVESSLLHEVTSGTNGACRLLLGRGCTAEEQAADCASRPICVAGPGYDGPTGVGTLRGIEALEPRLAFRTSPPSPARRGGSFAAEADVEESGAPAPVASATPTVCAVTAGEVSLLAAGACTLTSAEPGYVEARQSFVVERALQTLAFSTTAPAEAVAGGPAYVPEASASSGLPVAFVSLTPAVCTVQANAVEPLISGLCEIAAEQAGDGDYEPAATITQSYAVSGAAQTIAFLSEPPGDAVAGGPAYTVQATASSGLPVSLASLTPGVCALEGASVSLLAPGTCTLGATQDGDAVFAAAPEARQSFAVAAPPPAPAPAGGTLSFHATPTPFAGPATLRLRAAPSASPRDGAITLSLAVAPAGTLRWLMTFSRPAACRPHARSCVMRVVRFASGSRTVPGGLLTIKAGASGAALRALRALRGRALRVRVTLSLTPASGAPAQIRETVPVRLTRAR